MTELSILVLDYDQEDDSDADDYEGGNDYDDWEDDSDADYQEDDCDADDKEDEYKIMFKFTSSFSLLISRIWI